MERELWKILYRLAKKLDSPWGNWRYSTADVLAAYFWAVVHDRPTSWAADPKQWPDELRPALLPCQSTLSRRLRRPTTVKLMTAVEEHLLALVVEREETRRDIKSTPFGARSRCRSPGFGVFTAYGTGFKPKSLPPVFDGCLCSNHTS